MIISPIWLKARVDIYIVYGILLLYEEGRPAAVLPLFFMV